MTWWREQLTNHSTAYAIGALIGGVIWMFRTVFRNAITVQYQADQIREMRADVRELNQKFDRTHDEIADLRNFLIGSDHSAGSKPHIRPRKEN